jgi:hypothetical protein
LIVDWILAIADSFQSLKGFGIDFDQSKLFVQGSGLNQFQSLKGFGIDFDLQEELESMEYKDVSIPERVWYRFRQSFGTVRCKLAKRFNP